MKFKDIVAVSGMPGLYEMVSAKSNGAVIKSLGEVKTQFVSNRLHTFSPLNKISIYTIDTDSELLSKVIQKIQQYEANEGVTAPSHKDDPNTLRAFMTNVLPNIDNNRVYGSDLQKLMKWYAILKTIELTFEPEELLEETAPDVEELADFAEAEVTQTQEEQTTEEQTEENPAG